MHVSNSPCLRSVWISDRSEARDQTTITRRIAPAWSYYTFDSIFRSGNTRAYDRDVYTSHAVVHTNTVLDCIISCTPADFANLTPHFDVILNESARDEYHQFIWAACHLPIAIAGTLYHHFALSLSPGPPSGGAHLSKHNLLWL